MDARTASSCPRARHRLRALLSLFLTVTLATSLLPAPAFAAASAGDGAAVQTAVAAAEVDVAPSVDGESGEGDTAPDDSGADAGEAADGATAEAPAPAPAEKAAPAEASAEPSAEASGSASVATDPSAPSPSEAPEGASAWAPAARAAASEAAAAPFAAATFDDNCFATIRSFATASSTATAGPITVGETRYAFAYKGTTRKSQIKDPANAWVYTWYVGDAQSPASLEECEPIEGQTGQSITFTSEVSEGLIGKYLFVEITAPDGTTANGSRVGNRSDKALAGIGPIKDPDPVKTALDEDCFVAIQASADEEKTYNRVEGRLGSGQTLYANVYDGEPTAAKRMESQPTWSYQWLKSADQRAADDAFEPIEGQTSSKLEITDELAAELAGSYVRVRVEGDGQVLYGPSTAFDTPAAYGSYTPGPVAAPGQIALNHVLLAYNGADFGSEVESTPKCRVGDTVRAGAYHSEDPYTTYGGDAVDFAWLLADDPEGPFEVVAEGETWTAGPEHEGRYFKVRATAKSGIPGLSVAETPAGKVLAEGACTLSSVKIANASKGAMDTGAVLQAVAYTADDWGWGESPVGADVSVAYQWYVSAKDPDSYSSGFDAATDWTPIPGATGSSLTVPADFEGQWVGVSAFAGDNRVMTAGSGAAGPFKAPGSYEIYTIPAMVKVSGDLSDRFVFKTGEVITVEAFATSVAGTKGEAIPAEALSVTWKIADSQFGEYVELDDENVHAAAFRIPRSYEGKHLMVEVSAGFNTEESIGMRNPIALGAEAASYDLSSVSIEGASDPVYPGAALTARARCLDETSLVEGAEVPLPANAEASYDWYVSPTPDRADAALAKAGDLVGSYKPARSDAGSYVFVRAVVGDTEAWSEPVFVEVPPAFGATVSVVGASAPAADGTVHAESWVAPAPFTWEAGTEAKAWDAFAEALTGAGYLYSLAGACPYSITTPDRSRTLAMSASAPWSYWAFFVNGAYADTMASGYVLKPGDRIELRYLVGGLAPAPGEDEPSVSPDAPHPEVELAFGAGRDNVAHASDFVASGTSAAPGTAKWTSSLLADEERAAGSSASVSAPFMLGGYVYIVTGSVNYAQGTASAARLEVRDAATGEVLRSVALARPMDTTCRPAYSDGIVVVPLSGGWLQAVSAVTLETLWVSPGTAGAQSLSSVTVADGLVYACTADELAAGTYEAVRGTVRCVDLLTGEERGAFANERAGYYWAGGVAVGGLYLVADDRGTVTAFEQGLAKVAATLDVGAGVRSALVRDGDDVLAVTRDGVLHRISMAGGRLTEVGKVKFADSSTSTPTVAGGLVYVGGAQLDGAGPKANGVLAVIDPAAMTVVHRVTRAAGTAIPGDVKSTPLVVLDGSARAAGGTTAYFTANAPSGAVYAYRPGDAEASVAFRPAPEAADYCMATVHCGPDGTLYYTNDSGHLFAVTPGTVPPSGPGTGEEEKPGGNGGGSGDPGLSGSSGQGGGAGGAQDGSRRPAGGLQGALFGRGGAPALRGAGFPAGRGALPFATGATGAASPASSDGAAAAVAAASDEAVPLASKGGAEGSADGAPLGAEAPARDKGLALTGLALGVLGLGASLFLLLAARRRREE